MAKDKAAQHPLVELGKATRFKKGQSGNPKGREKGFGITDRLRKIVEQDKDGTLAEALANAATEAALAGDFRFWNAIVERLDGKSLERVETDGTLRVEVHHVKVAKQIEDNADDSD